MAEPCDLSATDALALMAVGELSPAELTASCLARADAVDPAVNALVVRDDFAAHAAARSATEALAAASGRRPLSDARAVPPDARSGHGPAGLGALWGLPVAVKDIHATAGLTTTYGAAPFASNVPTRDDGIVARVRRAGAVIVGKTNTPELSIGANTVNRLFGATGNPFDPAMTCGGSSGGSAVAVACGMAPLATGSDHGGSLRIPASYCGVAAHRSTPGTVPFSERTMTRTNYSVAGPMARTVADVALGLSVMAARDRDARRDPMAFPLDAAALAVLEPVDLAGLRIGVSADLGGLLVSQATRRLFADRVERLSGLVGAVDAASLDLRDALDADWQLRADVFATAYHRSIHRFAADPRPDASSDVSSDASRDAHPDARPDARPDAPRPDGGFNPNIVATYDTALRTSVLDIAVARRRQMELFASADAVFDDFDVLICPGVSVQPFDWHELWPAAIDGTPVANYMAWLGLSAALTVIGHPVTALPCGVDDRGLPFGLQVVGPSYADRRLLSIAAALEAAFADDPVMARPVPDIAWLSSQRTACRTEGRLVHASVA